MKARTIMLAATLVLVGVATVAVPTASACGFEEDIAEVGPVWVGLECTRPTVYVDGDRVDLWP